MSAADQRNDRFAYLTVIAWPKDIEVQEMVRRMAAPSGGAIDEPTLRLKCKQPPPCIVGQYARPVAQSAVSVILKAGGDAFMPTLDDIEGLGATHKIKDLRLEGGKFVADLWRGETTSLDPHEVEILIRAKLSEAKKSISGGAAQDLSDSLMLRSMVTTASVWGTWSWGGAYGLAGAFYPYSALEIGNVPYLPETTTHDKLDIHLKDGRVFQVDGDKFGFRILGEQRGPSDNVNIDRMCELFTHLAPEAVVDPYFSLWRPPAGVKQLRLPHMLVNNDDPAFAFYSRWAALMYRHIMNSAKPAPPHSRS